jgi:hypothetical protein
MQTTCIVTPSRDSMYVHTHNSDTDYFSNHHLVHAPTYTPNSITLIISYFVVPITDIRNRISAAYNLLSFLDVTIHWEYCTEASYCVRTTDYIGPAITIRV